MGRRSRSTDHAFVVVRLPLAAAAARIRRLRRGGRGRGRAVDERALERRQTRQRQRQLEHPGGEHPKLAVRQHPGGRRRNYSTTSSRRPRLFRALVISVTITSICEKKKKKLPYFNIFVITIRTGFSEK